MAENDQGDMPLWVLFHIIKIQKVAVLLLKSRPIPHPNFHL